MAKRLRAKRRGLKTVKGLTELGKKLGVQGPPCPLWQLQPDVAASGSKAVTKCAALAAAQAKADLAADAAKSAASAVETLKADAEAAVDVFLVTVEGHSPLPEDFEAMGLTVRIDARNPLVPPAHIYAEWDPVANVTNLWVDPAPGILTYKFQQSSASPATEDSYQDVEGIGATRAIKKPAPGTYSYRVKSTRGGKDSDFVGPVSVLVK